MRPGRRCSRTGCAGASVATLTYVYSDSTAVLGPLATHAEPHCYDLCDVHAARLTVPRGWEVVRLSAAEDSPPPPSRDDLLALVDAVREAGKARPVLPPEQPAPGGRRGHLRVVPGTGRPS